MLASTYFDPALETGQAVKGDIAVELIDSTNICFGNAACDEVQRQPYIIIAMRRDADEVRPEARANGISASDAEAIRPDDSGEYHRYRTSSGQRPRDLYSCTCAGPRTALPSARPRETRS